LKKPFAPFIEPEPSFRVPFHCALAFAIAIVVSPFQGAGQMVVIAEITAMKKRSRSNSKTRRKGVSKAKQAEAALRALALRYPGAREEFPWGDRVVKVGKKVFVFMGTTEDGGFGLSVKLPASGPMALLLPFATPTGYGLGKSGWVSARFTPSDAPPVALLRAWIDESYRAIAPKRLLQQLEAARRSPAAAKSK
jgi:predicted DNA-binding protein (MmcQ/YjbR family)